jgi:hypothetical protein
LCEWELDADYLDDDFLSGVLPVLFAANPHIAEAAIVANPDNAKKDLERLARMFFIPEGLNIEMAAQVVRKPRLGEADYIFKSRNLERLFEAPSPLPGQSGKFFFSNSN